MRGITGFTILIALTLPSAALAEQHSFGAGRRLKFQQHEIQASKRTESELPAQSVEARGQLSTVEQDVSRTDQSNSSAAGSDSKENRAQFGAAKRLELQDRNSRR